MSSYTVTAERGRRWWVLQCVEHPGAMSEVARLDQAADAIREAIAFVAEVPAAEVEIQLRPTIPDKVQEHLAAAERLREESQQSNRAAASESRAAARALQFAGLSLRDIGTIMGISYQRAHQLVTQRSALESDRYLGTSSPRRDPAAAGRRLVAEFSDEDRHEPDRSDAKAELARDLEDKWR